MNLIGTVLLMAGQSGQQSNPLMSFLPLLLIIVVFYFFMIRPQMKKQKEIKKFRESLKEGDKVITLGGIYGRIADIKENYVLLEIEDKVRMKVDKSALVRDSSDIEEKK